MTVKICDQSVNWRIVFMEFSPKLHYIRHMNSKSAFREALITHLESTPGLKVPQLARETGVSKYQLEKLVQRRVESTNVYDAVRIAQYFGKTVEEFVGKPENLDLQTLMGRIRQLAPEEQAKLLHSQIDALKGVTSKP